MKFGGTSVADADAMTRVINIVRGHIARFPNHTLPIVVVSAMSKVTDRLVETGRLAGQGDADGAAALLRDLAGASHSRRVRAGPGRRAGDDERAAHAGLQCVDRTRASVGRARRGCRRRPPTKFSRWASWRAVAWSPRHSSGRAFPAAWVDSRKVLVTDNEHTAAAPDTDATCRRTHELVASRTKAGEVPVLGGFIGATAAGVTTTLGRGGSDYSAAIFGACLDVDEIQIWTDVDGMLTADPRVVNDPQLVPQLSFSEASELAYFGAKVLHPSTILPAVAKNIPVRILNSRRPEVEGTMITADGRADGPALTALACKRGVTVVDITSTRMLMAHGFLRRLFEIFERFKTPVDVVTTSEVSVSVTVDNTRRLNDIVNNLEHFAEVNTEPDMAIVCIVGENLRSDPSLFARAVTALEGVPLRLVSQAASRRNITFVMRDADVVKAMNCLHDAFFATV